LFLLRDTLAAHRLLPQPRTVAAAGLVLLVEMQLQESQAAAGLEEHLRSLERLCFMAVVAAAAHTLEPPRPEPEARQVEETALLPSLQPGPLVRRISAEAEVAERVMVLL
jgi:hypothetical protein